MVVFNKDCRKQFLLPDRVLVPRKKPTEIVNGLFTKKANKLVIDHDPSDPRLLCERPRHREGGQRQGLAEQVWANDFLLLEQSELWGLGWMCSEWWDQKVQVRWHGCDSSAVNVPGFSSEVKKWTEETLRGKSAPFVQICNLFVQTRQWICWELRMRPKGKGSQAAQRDFLSIGLLAQADLLVSGRVLEFALIYGIYLHLYTLKNSPQSV